MVERDYESVKELVLKIFESIYNYEFPGLDMNVYVDEEGNPQKFYDAISDSFGLELSDLENNEGSIGTLEEIIYAVVDTWDGSTLNGFNENMDYTSGGSENLDKGTTSDFYEEDDEFGGYEDLSEGGSYGGDDYYYGENDEDSYD